MTSFATMSGPTVVILIVLVLCLALVLAAGVIDRRGGSHWPWSSPPGEEK